MVKSNELQINDKYSVHIMGPQKKIELRKDGKRWSFDPPYSILFLVWFYKTIKLENQLQVLKAYIKKQCYCLRPDVKCDHYVKCDHCNVIKEIEEL